MGFKEYLMSLEWNTFSRYPEQGSSIYLHCFTEDGSLHKFVKISHFNAVFLDLYVTIRNYNSKKKWLFSWVPADETDRNYANSNFN